MDIDYSMSNPWCSQYDHCMTWDVAKVCQVQTCKFYGWSGQYVSNSISNNLFHVEAHSWIEQWAWTESFLAICSCNCLLMSYSYVKSMESMLKVLNVEILELEMCKMCTLGDHMIAIHNMIVIDMWLSWVHVWKILKMVTRSKQEHTNITKKHTNIGKEHS